MRQTEWVDGSNPQTSVELCEAAHGTTGSTSMTAAEAGGATYVAFSRIRRLPTGAAGCSSDSPKVEPAAIPRAPTSYLREGRYSESGVSWTSAASAHRNAQIPDGSPSTFTPRAH
jgi:hypothetical protein